MKVLNTKSGFTLIEIIVVLIIVGILAAIALPNLMSNVQRSAAGEGIAGLGPYKSQVEGCVMTHPGSENTLCSAITQIATKNFTYAFGTNVTNGGSGGNYTLVATGPNGNIVLTKNTLNNSLTCSGTASYAGAC